MQQQQRSPLDFSNTYHEEVLVSEGMGSRGGPCQHLYEPSHDPGGVALPRMHPSCHSVNTNSVTFILADCYTAYKLVTKPSSYHRAVAEAHDVAKAHITTSGLRILRLTT